MELVTALNTLCGQLHSLASSERQAKMFAAYRVMIRQIALVSPEPADHPSMHAQCTGDECTAALLHGMLCHSDKPIPNEEVLELCNHLQQLTWLAMTRQFVSLSSANAPLCLPAIS